MAAARAAAAGAGSAWRAWASTFPLTGRATQALMITGGVFVGSALWWLALSATVARFRARVRPHHLTWVNRVAGAMLVGFAAWAAVSAV